ncbi:MAG: FtsX-like permease family protein [Geminicoccaceae bacterium]
MKDLLTELGRAARLARREMRGSARGFVVFMLCLALGVAAIAAVGNVNRSVGLALARDGRALMGGDLEFEQANNELDPGAIVHLLPDGSRLSSVVRTNTIAKAESGRNVVVELKAVDAAWPLYGEAQFDPPMAPEEGLKDGVAVEPALLGRLGLQVGDKLHLGDTEVPIVATIVREPDRLGGFVNIGPRVILHRDLLDRAHILQPGALARFEVRAALPDGTDADALATRLNAENPDAGWRVQAVSAAQAQTTRFTDRLATFLTLAGLTALLTGGLGIALAVRAYLDRRRTSIATLRCLGATSDQVFAIYLLQVMALAACGVALGLVAGMLLPLLTYLIPAGTIPVTLSYSVGVGPLLLAAACGMTAAFVFALWPLALAREIPPAGLFRALVEPQRRWPRPFFVGLLIAGAALLAALAIFGVAQPRLAAWFVGITLAAIVVLILLTRGLLLAARRVAHRGPYPLRLAIANLHRPGTGAPSVVVALGAGLAVLTAVALLYANLAREVAVRLPERAPGMILIDVQPDQRDGLAQIVTSVPGASVVQEMPSLRARIVRIADKPAEEVKVAPNVEWTIRRDRGLSYAAQPPDDTKLVAGSWWAPDYAGPPLVSIDSEIAQGYGVRIGDTLSFNVLGRPVEATIANIREEIDWGSGRLGFLFILSPGLLDKAPHTWAATVQVPPEGENQLLDVLATKLPNVTPISIREIVGRVAEMMAKIGLAIEVVALVTLAAGVLVLAGAVAAARDRHRYETVLLKVLGARRSQLLTALLVEYGVIGLAAVISGGVLGTLGAYVVVRFVMDLPWVLPMAVPLTVTGLALGLTLLVSGTGLWRLLGQPAAPVLRSP